LFVNDLLQAYKKYAILSGLKVEILTEEYGHVVAKIYGKNAWEVFKNEPGKHVVQRVPPTERNGRRQTSYLTVAILTLPPENTQEPLCDKDLEIICQTGKQGAGGQNVNRIKSAVRMKHKPTGLSVFINGRDQGQNKAEALRILTFRVNEQKKLACEARLNSSRKNQMQGSGDKIGGRGDKVRTYNFIRGEVVDHNLDVSTFNIKEFMKGNFSVLFQGKGN